MYEFKLPDIGEGMHEGEIRRWLVQEGQQVAADEPLVEVQTDKVTAELPAPVSGVVRKLCVSEGSVVPVGTVLAILEDSAAQQGDGTAAAGIAEMRGDQGRAAEARGHGGGSAEVHAVPAAAAHSASTAASPRGRRALATPHVRSLARKLGVNIDEVPGTGPAGRVTEEDLQRFVAALKEAAQAAVGGHEADVAALARADRPAQPTREGQAAPRTAAAAVVKPVPQGAEPVEEVPLRGIRRRIAEHMVKSVQTIPHVTHVDEVEMEAVDALRQRLKPAAEARGVKLTFLPFYIKALTVALREFPYLNASVDNAGERILLKRYYHIGVAVDTDEGLIVPVIRHADQKSLFDIAAEVADLASRARAGRLALHEVTGSTFTVSNVGPIGGLYATPIINHPEAAILGLHKMEPRPVVRDGQLVIRKMMHISLSFDHRIIDGAMAVRFTNRIKALMEDPDLMWAELR